MSTDIIAAIVGAVVTGVLGFVAYQYKQRRGNQVIVKILSQTPQITLLDSVQQKLEIIYNGRQIKNLVLTQLTICNQGSNMIKPLKLTIGVSPKPGQGTSVDSIIADNRARSIINEFTYVELNVNDPRGITISRMDSQTSSFEIERPYINPKKKYAEEEIKVSVFSDVLLDFSVNGGGEDWASKLVYNEEPRKRILFLVSAFSGILGGVLGLLVNYLFIYNIYVPGVTFIILIMVAFSMLIGIVVIFAKLMFGNHK